MNKFLIGLGVATVAFAAWVVLSDPAYRTAPATGAGSGPDAIDEAGNAVGRWGTRQRAGGLGDRLKGTLQQAGGQLTGNPDLADRGAVSEAGGRLRDAVGEVAQAAGQTLKDLNG